MAAVYKSIDGYQIWFYGKPQHYLLIQVYKTNVYTGSLIFRDSATLPDNELDPVGYIRLSFHKSDYDRVIDILRNEKPLFIWINPDNKIGGIATESTEPVGEGEA